MCSFLLSSKVSTGLMRDDMISKYVSDVTSKPVKGTYLRELWTTSTKVVAGTPEKPLRSIKNADTSRIHDSPERTPGLKVWLPNGP